MSVAIVTDSTAYLPDGYAARWGIRVVPLHVSVNGTARRDGVDVGAAELARAMMDRQPVSTSRATPSELTELYRGLLDDGFESIVSVHLSRQLSGTWDAARLAAQQLGPEQIRVIDSRSAAMGLGFAVLAAAQAAADGVDPADIERRAMETVERTRTFFCLETLEYLRRGGRISTTAAIVGTALAVKPVLHVADGRISMLEKVRTFGRGLNRLVELAAQEAGDRPVDLAVHHLGAPDRAQELATLLRHRLPSATGCVIAELGAVLGAHTGPGVVGVVVLPGGLSTA
ncbi:DegV family protein [Pseudonocardiaceae bacterium YIM PH 21723]|nr:DegV family protein [Pseudonocardiaceae bacterium YIM PH 21723]